MDHTLIAKEALHAQAEAVRALAERIGAEFQSAVNLILQCQGRVVVSGIGKSGHIARKFSATLSSTGTPGFYLHPGEAFHGDLGMIRSDDLLILVSYSGETEETIKLIPSLKAFGNKIIAMAGYRDSSLGKYCDVFLDISVSREVCPNNLAPTTSTLATMAMGDALAVALIQARNFQPVDFARFHPGGTLGRKLLLRVRDVMHVNLPKVTPKTLFHDCIFTMTSGRMGLALVMEGEELIGLLTDGDLRRAFIKDPQFLHKPVSEFMTKTPTCIQADTLLVEAEAVMRAKKIRALVALDGREGKVCGVVEIFA